MTSQKGFSLMELMIVLVVAGIVLSIGLPAFSSYRNTLALRQARAQLTEDIRSARQIAITRRAPVYIRFGAPPSTTDITAYQIHVDSNNNHVIDVGERVMQRKLPSTTKLSNVALAPVDTLCFDISGILWPGNNGGTLVYQNQRAKRDTLVVSTAGICYHP